jgi:hypothetical protein
MTKSVCKCKCGSKKPRRYFCCGNCFSKMHEDTKRLYQAASRLRESLRRWQVV